SKATLPGRPSPSPKATTYAAAAPTAARDNSFLIRPRRSPSGARTYRLEARSAAGRVSAWRTLKPVVSPRSPGSPTAPDDFHRDGAIVVAQSLHIMIASTASFLQPPFGGLRRRRHAGTCAPHGPDSPQFADLGVDRVRETG